MGATEQLFTCQITRWAKSHSLTPCISLKIDQYFLTTKPLVGEEYAYCKTPIIRLHTKFCEFCKYYKITNLNTREKFLFPVIKFHLHRISTLLVNIFCSEWADYCSSLQTVMHTILFICLKSLGTLPCKVQREKTPN